MNKAETAKLLAYLLADHGAEVTDAKVCVWADQLTDVPYQVGLTVARYMVSRKSFGVPKVQDFRAALEDILEASGGLPWGDAFDLWIKIARKCGFYRKDWAKQIYAQQCPRGARALGTMADEYFELRTQDLPNYRAQFRMKYEAAEAKEAKFRCLPAHLTKAISDLSKNFSMENLLGTGRQEEISIHSISNGTRLLPSPNAGAGAHQGSSSPDQRADDIPVRAQKLLA